MKKYLHIALMLLCVAVVSSSCKKDKDDPVDEVWKLGNEKAFQNKAADASFTKLEALTNDGHIFYKVLEPGDGERIFYTDTVQVYYKGCLVGDKDGNLLTDLSNVLKDGACFDKNMLDDGEPAQFAVKGVIAGWQTALQYMRVGARWEIWIPQELAYGKSGGTSSNGIYRPPYSTLVFDVEVVKKVTKK